MSEETNEEKTQNSEVIVSDEMNLNQIQPLVMKGDKNEIPLIEPDLKREGWPVTDMKHLLHPWMTVPRKLNLMRKKKKRWKKRFMEIQNCFMEIQNCLKESKPYR